MSVFLPRSSVALAIVLALASIPVPTKHQSDDDAVAQLKARQPQVVATMKAMLAEWTTTLEGDITPAWARGRPSRVMRFQPDGPVSAEWFGEQLARRISELEPGDYLQIPTGTYVIDDFFNISLQGEDGLPIWIGARPGDRVTITRSNPKQNVINVGTSSQGPARYLILQGLEITGGSMGLRLVDCDHVWVDQCHIHHNAGPALTTNQADTSHLTITRNHIHHTGGTGEGMYLGANWSKHRMTHSLIALNRVHDCGGSQGDGIEVKQGSWGNVIVANDVRNTKGPCIIAYGTDGRGVNVIEHNICIGSRDNVMQVQGEAVVRNNMLIDGAFAFHSHDHQGDTRLLTVELNTMITRGDATDLYSWPEREDMVFRRNVIYSEGGQSLVFPLGSADVDVSGNLVYGPTKNVPANGTTPLADMADLATSMRELGAVPEMTAADW